MLNRISRSLSLPFVLVTSLFFMWGFITVLVDSLIPRLRELFVLSYFQAGLLQFAFFLAYGLFSIPAGGILARIGYKSGILLGLTTMGLGCLLFWPAAGVRSFELFLLGSFILAAGMTVLQVAANPYVAELGPEAGASSRLNLAQAFNSLGTTIAPIVGALFILGDNVLPPAAIAALDTVAREGYFLQESVAVQAPFVTLAIALFLLAGVFALIKLPRILTEAPRRVSAFSLMRGRLGRGALGIFLYVGAEVAIGSYLVSYFMSMDLAPLVRDNAPMSKLAQLFLGNELNAIGPSALVGAFVALYWGGAMVGRFVGSALTKRFAPGNVLAVFALIAGAMVSLSMATEGLVAMWSILAVGLFNSIMFPTIFALSIEGLGDLKPQASGILCTAIVGGAVVPPLLGLFADYFGFKIAFGIVLLCYGYIALLGQRTLRTDHDPRN